MLFPSGPPSNTTEPRALRTSPAWLGASRWNWRRPSYGDGPDNHPHAAPQRTATTMVR